jgi:hypothetical protein
MLPKISNEPSMGNSKISIMARVLNANNGDMLLRFPLWWAMLHANATSPSWIRVLLHNIQWLHGTLGLDHQPKKTSIRLIWCWDWMRDVNVDSYVVGGIEWGWNCHPPMHIWVWPEGRWEWDRLWGHSLE